MYSSARQFVITVRHGRGPRGCTAFREGARGSGRTLLKRGPPSRIMHADRRSRRRRLRARHRWRRERHRRDRRTDVFDGSQRSSGPDGIYELTREVIDFSAREQVALPEHPEAD